MCYLQGFTGPYCDNCADNWYRPAEGECIECAGSKLASMMPMFAALVLLVFTGSLVYKSQQRFLSIVRHAEEHGFKKDLVDFLHPIIQPRIVKFGE